MCNRLSLSLTLILIALAVGLGTNASGQTVQPISDYVVRGFSFNPAIAGLSNALSIQLNGVQQLAAMKGSPYSGSFLIHSPVYNTQMAIGGGVMMDRFGPTTNLNAFINYSHLVKISDYKLLSLGLRASVNNYRVNFNEISLENQSDPLFASNIDGAMKSNFGVGAHFYTSDFFLSASMPSVLSSTIYSDTKGAFSENKCPLYFSTGYYFDFSKALSIRPSLLTRKIKGEQTLTDFSLQVFYGSIFSAGLSYRVKNALVFLLGADLGQSWQLSYAYDYPTGSLSNLRVGRHELTLQYNYHYDWRRSSRYILKTKKKKESLKSLRYF